MTNTPVTFRQKDVERALRAVEKTCGSATVATDKNGDILITPVVWRTPPKRPSYVYLIVNEGKVKIGFTMSPERRLDTFSKCVGRPMQWAALVEGSVQEEQQLHQHFSEYRVYGEWFDIRGAVADMMQDPAANIMRLLEALRCHT